MFSRCFPSALVYISLMASFSSFVYLANTHITLFAAIFCTCISPSMATTSPSATVLNTCAMNQQSSFTLTFSLLWLSFTLVFHRLSIYFLAAVLCLCLFLVLRCCSLQIFTLAHCWQHSIHHYWGLLICNIRTRRRRIKLFYFPFHGYDLPSYFSICCSPHYVHFFYWQPPPMLVFLLTHFLSFKLAFLYAQPLFMHFIMLVLLAYTSVSPLAAFHSTCIFHP